MRLLKVLWLLENNCKRIQVIFKLPQEVKLILKGLLISQKGRDSCCKIQLNQQKN
jgi:hypothetical protein